jgi:alcohol dehydrogenase (NADP+)
LHTRWRDLPLWISTAFDTLWAMSTPVVSAPAPHVHTHTARAYAAADRAAALSSVVIPRRAVGARDVEIEILYCGVCHSDLHQARNEWQNTIYPCVPGHEIVGRVKSVGAEVTRFNAGDLAGVGCLVGSCGVCDSCRDGLEQYCETNPVFTYNSPDPQTGLVTYGGYSDRIVVDEAFTLRIPDTLAPAAVAPLLCAGITTYSPLHHWNVGTGQKVGVVGLGGLGHMGVKLAHAMGAEVVLFTTSRGKVADGKRLGADEVVISSNPDELARHTRSFDFILDTVSAQHDLNAYLPLLKRDATLTLVGAPEHPLPVSAFGLIFGRRRLAGSAIGGIRETQEMLDFCGAHGITADIEMIPIQQINHAYERLLKSDVKYRFVIDMASLAVQ